jgi:hypothetical protein
VESESLRAAFVDVTRAMAQFVRRSLDNPRPYMKEADDGSTALEVDLQDDLIEFLTYAYPLDGVTGYEPQKVAGGRADIMLVVFNEVLYVECKREHVDAAPDVLASAYAAQGGAYSAAQHRLGIVAVLDLTAVQSASPPLFRDCLWIHEQTVADGGRVLLFVKVPGRRVTPSALSR